MWGTVIFERGVLICSLNPKYQQRNCRSGQMCRGPKQSSCPQNLRKGWSPAEGGRKGAGGAEAAPSAPLAGGGGRDRTEKVQQLAKMTWVGQRCFCVCVCSQDGFVLVLLYFDTGQWKGKKSLKKRLTLVQGRAALGFEPFVVGHRQSSVMTKLWFHSFQFLRGGKA